jgi:hypothetical protein
MTTKKADFRHFLNSSKLSIVAARSCRHTQVMLQTVTLFYIQCGMDRCSSHREEMTDVCGRAKTQQWGTQPATLTLEISSSGRAWQQKAHLRHFLNSSKLSIVAARSCRHTQVMLQTVILFYIHCAQSCILWPFWPHFKSKVKELEIVAVAHIFTQYQDWKRNDPLILHFARFKNQPKK